MKPRFNLIKNKILGFWSIKSKTTQEQEYLMKIKDRIIWEGLSDLLNNEGKSLKALLLMLEYIEAEIKQPKTEYQYNAGISSAFQEILTFLSLTLGEEKLIQAQLEVVRTLNNGQNKE